MNNEIKVLNIAHRGASGVAPENTLAAFKKAIEVGADMIEFDVHQTKDKEIVIRHSCNLSKIMRKKGLIEDYTLKELKKIPIGAYFSPEYEDERIPTLEEVIDIAKDKIGINIEIKKGRKLYEGIEKRIIRIVNEANLNLPCIISSFYLHYLKEIRKLDKYIALGKFLTYSIFLPREDFLYDCNVIQPHWSMVTSFLVKQAHKDHLRVNTWVVNNPRLMVRLIKLGVDGIMTDYPERLNWVRSKFSAQGSEIRARN